MNNSKKHSVQKLISLLILGIGFCLLIFMITMEGEPGAIPLFMIFFGAGWYFLNRAKLRSVRNHG